MQKWEYLTIGATDKNSDDKLKNYGLEGWELVQVTSQTIPSMQSHPSGAMVTVMEVHYVLWFKRPAA